MVAAFGSSPPASFDYRSADPEFGVWGWSFAADSERAVEFLDVTDASGGGMTLTGSGKATVITAGYFSPGQTLTLTGAVEPSATADSEGRITFHVDLGPTHTLQQYTLQQRAAETLAGAAYWTSRNVTFEEV